MDQNNKVANEDLTGGGDRVTWPDKDHAPETPTNPIELAIRIITILKILPAFADSEFRYAVLEAANLCWRFLPDTILPVSLSRRLGKDNTFLYFVRNY